MMFLNAVPHALLCMGPRSQEPKNDPTLTAQQRLQQIHQHQNWIIDGSCMSDESHLLVHPIDGHMSVQHFSMETVVPGCTNSRKQACGGHIILQAICYDGAH